MSGYWDAVVRAALDLSAAAQPLPQSRFDAEQQHPGADELLVEENVETPAARDRPTVLPESRPLVAVPVQHLEPAERRRTEGLAREPARESRGEALPGSRAEGAGQELAAPIAALPSRVQPEASPVLRRVEHVDVQRFETIHTLAEPVVAPRLAGMGEPQPVTLEVGTSAPPLAEPVTVAEPAAARDRDAPTVAVAEPAEPAPMAEVVPPVGPDLPQLVIEIDRVDIRIEPQMAPPAAPAVASRRVEAGPVPSLSDYLARRSEARG